MKKNNNKTALNLLTKLSISVAKTTVNSTTRFTFYQPKEDHDVYLKMKNNKMV